MQKIIIKNIAISAVLMALGVILKYFSITIPPTLRISFFAVPLILSGIIGGIPMGLVTAFGADLIYGLFLNPYPYNVGFALSALYWGVLGGIFHMFIKRKDKLPLFIILIGIFITSLLETHTNVLMTLCLYGTHTAFVDLLQKYLVLIVKFPFIVFVIKILYERVIKKLNLIN